MIDAVDNELRVRFAALADRTDDSSWAEVRARAPRRRFRAPLAVAAAVALMVAVSASAVGLPERIVRLFGDSAPAPPQVASSFSSFEDLTGVRLTAAPREVLATTTGRDEAATLWVTPTASSGFCTLVKLRLRGGASEGAGGECGPRLRRLSVDVTLHGPFASNGAVLGGPVLVKGFVGLPRADSLRLEFQDGASVSIPLVWVSKPVEMAFFLYGVPSGHWRRGHLPTKLTVRAANGDELAHEDINGIPPG
jgi:hypothetical protein